MRGRCLQSLTDRGQMAGQKIVSNVAIDEKDPVLKLGGFLRIYADSKYSPFGLIPCPPEWTQILKA